MTLLVVLGFVVIATILAALYLSLRSARGGEREPALGAGGASARGRQARGKSRPERSPSRGGRLVAKAASDKGAGMPGRRASRDADDRHESSDYMPPHMRGGDRPAAAGPGRGPGDPRSAGPPSAGSRPPGRRSPGFSPAGPRSADPRPANGADPRRGAAAEFPADATDPEFRSSHGGRAPGYDGYDSAAETRLSGPMDDMPGADGYDRGPAPYRGYAGGTSGGHYSPGGPSFDPAPPAHANGNGTGGLNGNGNGAGLNGAGLNGHGRRAAAPGDRSGTEGFAGHEADPARRGYGNGAAPNGYSTGPNARRPETPGGRYPEPPRRSRNPDAAGDATAGNRGYGAAERGPDATERFTTRKSGFGTREPGSGSGEPGFGTGEGEARPVREGLETGSPALTDGPFSPAPDSDPAPGGSGEESRSGRRRAGKFQRPHLRMHRGRPDYDDAPWPAADESEGVSDEDFWADLSLDKPLATTARTAGEPDQSRRPGDPAGQDPSEPVAADSSGPVRGRRGRRREEEQAAGTEPRPYQQPDTGSGAGLRRRGRGEPTRSERTSEEDPLTSASFSRHAREASDSRSYRASRESRPPAPQDRRESSMADTQALMPDRQGFNSRSPGMPGTGPRARRGAPDSGDRSAPGQRDSYRDGTYGGGARPAGPYGDRPGGYELPGRGSRQASGPEGAPPAGPANGHRRQRPAMPGPALPGPRSPAGPGAGPNGRPDSSRDPGGTGYRSQPNGPAGRAGSPGYGTGSGPHQQRSADGTGDYPEGRRARRRDNGRTPPDGYDDPYGRSDNGRY